MLLLGIFFIIPIFILFKGGEPLWQIYSADSNVFRIIFQLRVNATLVALVSGVGLAVCGLFLQTLFQNPLSSPYTLGVSSVSSLFISLYILLSSSIPMFAQNEILIIALQLLFSLLGSLISLFLIYKIQKRSSSNSLIVLIGILIGSFASSLSQLVEYMMTRDQLKSNFIWHLGSFEIYELSYVLVLCFFVIICLYMYFRKINDSNLYLLGQSYAQNSGLDVSNYQKHIFINSAILIAIITAFCGPIGFIGLVSPHIAKLILKSNHHRTLMFTTSLVGGLFALICLLISHSFIFNQMIPVNVISSILGVPITIFLMIKYFRQR